MYYSTTISLNNRDVENIQVNAIFTIAYRNGLM